MELKEQIGTRLREFRESLGVSQKDFSKMVGLRSNVWSNYENGVSYPQLPLLQKLHEDYGLSIDWLVSGGTGNYRPVTDMGAFLELLFKFPAFDLGEVTNPAYIKTVEEIEKTTHEPYTADSLLYGNLESLNHPVQSIVFNSPLILEFLDKYQKTKNAYASGAIDDELFSLWKEKQINEYKGKSIE